MTRVPLYERLHDWLDGKLVWDDAPLVFTLLPWIVVTWTVTIPLFILHHLCRLFLPRRWCP